MPEKKNKTQTPPSWTQAQRTRCAHHFRELYFLFFAQVNTKQEHVFFRLQAQPKWVCPETENTEQIKSLSQQSKTDLSGWSMASLRLNNKDLEQWHIHRSLAGKKKKKRSVSWSNCCPSGPECRGSPKGQHPGQQSGQKTQWVQLKQALFYVILKTNSTMNPLSPSDMHTSSRMHYYYN